MAITIYDKIEQRGNERIERILNEAKIEADRIKEEILSKAHSSNGRRVKKVEDDVLKQIEHQKKLVELEVRQSLLTNKQQILDQIFKEVLDKVEALEGKDLLNFVIKLITKEGFYGNEIIFTNKNTYDKLLAALSTNKKGELTELDLLNKKIGKNFKLSNKLVNINNGFLIEGTEYDLSFEFSEIVNKVRMKNEKAISLELFK
ncbi:V-type ATP synthase subunit E [Haploplasma modicum]|uniref:V-type ATP synthase subunit E n=1 Tax=Haploplasma modicum TaxID=2150 RepID=UPI00047DD8C1|nr:V-type ATP synthase subunit E [Haploplasma modicum]